VRCESRHKKSMEEGKTRRKKDEQDACTALNARGALRPSIFKLFAFPCSPEACSLLRLCQSFDNTAPKAGRYRRDRDIEPSVASFPHRPAEPVEGAPALLYAENDAKNGEEQIRGGWHVKCEFSTGRGPTPSSYSYSLATTQTQSFRPLRCFFAVRGFFCTP